MSTCCLKMMMRKTLRDPCVFVFTVSNGLVKDSEIIDCAAK